MQEPGGRRDGTCDHVLSRSWKVDVCEKDIYIYMHILESPTAVLPNIGVLYNSIRLET